MSTITADLKGIDGLRIYKPDGVQSTTGSNPGYAIDGKKSTQFVGRDLQLNLASPASVRTIGLKLTGPAKPERFRMQGAQGITARILRDVVENGFTYYVLSKPVMTKYVRVESVDDDMNIVTMQLYPVEPKPEGEIVPPIVPMPDPDVPPVTETPQPKPQPSTGDGPYPSIGEEMKGTRKPETGYGTRHYASGKDDDKTVEMNVKNILFDNYQFLVDIKITTIEHPDTASLKYGGTHMKSGWFDNTIRFGEKNGLAGLGTEEEHPSADLEIIKGKEFGDILNKKIRMAGIYFKKINKCELWAKYEGKDWDKLVEGTNVGGFNPNSKINEAQLRIDGFDKVPEIYRAVVQPIAGSK